MSQAPSTRMPSRPKLQHLSYKCPGFGAGARMDIRPENMGPFLMAQQIVIPLFQRRYCWTDSQFTHWVEDLQLNESHGLGKSRFKWINGEFVCIDGQQRITTTLLFLKSVLDASTRFTDSPQKDALANTILSHLFVNVEVYHSWIEEFKNQPIDDVLPQGTRL